MYFNKLNWMYFNNIIDSFNNLVECILKSNSMYFKTWFNIYLIQCSLNNLVECVLKSNSIYLKNLIQFILKLNLI